MWNFCLKSISKCTGTVFHGVLCLPWNTPSHLASPSICSNFAPSALFPDRTQGFGLLSTLAGANRSRGCEETPETEVNSNSWIPGSCSSLRPALHPWGGGWDLPSVSRSQRKEHYKLHSRWFWLYSNYPILGKTIPVISWCYLKTQQIYPKKSLNAAPISSVAEVAFHGTGFAVTLWDKVQGFEVKAGSTWFAADVFHALLDTQISLFPDSPTHPQETGKNPSQMVERMELAQTIWSLTVLQVSSALSIHTWLGCAHRAPEFCSGKSGA